MPKITDADPEGESEFFKRISEDMATLDPLIKAADKLIEGFKGSLSLHKNDRFKKLTWNRGLLNYQIEMIIDMYKKLENGQHVEPALIDEIGEIIKWMPFFLRFEREARNLLIENGKLRIFKKGDFVVNQGEIGESMFIIIHGSCNVLIKKKHPTKNIMIDYVYNLVNNQAYSLAYRWKLIRRVCLNEGKYKCAEIQFKIEPRVNQGKSYKESFKGHHKLCKYR